ncbi:DUF6603 domain-containing protein [Chryseobacterium sp. JJR-5R]|uniref:DUF6603 domain-containing protein n=1 Tax=Chryseobacterium sp. JJR-5R TaxID=3093923 RepID=UPI002A75047D|nr:DUF6603 domain-containing protein [Chryseobacterium sp. JJR-5R]WPO83779.1 DUF6603 domain-containing protein [Chryseobacterium sp. JJR-5R]
MELKVGIKDFELDLTGAFENNEQFSEMHLKNRLSDAKNRLSSIFNEHKDFAEAIDPLIPEEADFGVYKLKDKKSADYLSATRLELAYPYFNLMILLSGKFNLLSLSLNGTIGFSGFPLVGEYLKGYGISGLDLIYFSQKEKSLSEAAAFFLKRQFKDTVWIKDEDLKIKNHFNIGVEYHSGALKQTLVYPAKNTGKATSADALPDKNGEQEEQSGPGKEETKKKPPVRITEITPEIVNKSIQILLSAELNIGPFAFQVMGLGIIIPFHILNGFRFPDSLAKVQFAVKGLSLAYNTPTLSVSGAFMREIVEVKKADGKTEKTETYNGLVTFKMGKIEIVAIGSYIKTPAYSSLFAFGYLGVPIPVDPSFNILGLALGFGLNRNFVMPDISEVAEFPLVKIIKNGGLKEEDSVQKIFADLNRYIPAEENSYVIVAGIKFDTYKIIVTTGILAVAFGNKTSVNILGLSAMSLKGIYNIEFAFSLRADLEDGIFIARGQLTDKSYVLLPELKLTGGFAFGIWLKGEEAGDFVLSVGGYHPKFKAPSYYPDDIPRLGFNLNLGPVNIYGKIYYALTPGCIMAGIEAGIIFTYEGGLLYANIAIQFQADFIISWNPFFYEAEIACRLFIELRVGIGWFSISFRQNIIARLWVAGPDFGGKALIKIAGYELETYFGEKQKDKPKLLLPDFIKAYLNDTDKMLTCSISKGIIKKTGTGSGPGKTIVNPKDFVLDLYSQIPVTGITGISTGLADKKIYPVYSDSSPLKNILHIEVILGKTKIDFSSFSHELNLQSVARSIWNDKNSISDHEALSRENLLKEVCKGIRLEFSKTVVPVQSVPVSLYDTAVKNYEDAFDHYAVEKVNNGGFRPEGFLDELNLMEKDEFDVSDLENTIETYRYKTAPGTYRIV